MCLPGGDDFDGEAFEVTGLGEGDEDWVIGALGVIADVAKGLFGIHGGGRDVFEKQLA